MSNFNLRVRCSTGKPIPLVSFSSSETTLGDLYKILASLLSREEKTMKILSGFPPKHLQGAKMSSLSDLGLRNNEVVYLHPRTPTDPPQYTEKECNTIENNPNAATVPPPISATIDDCSNSIGSKPVSSNIVSPVIPPEEGKESKQSISSNISGKSIKRSASGSLRESTAKPGIFMEPSCEIGVLEKFVVPSDNSCLFASIDFILNGGTDPKRTQDLRIVASELVLTDPIVMNYLVDQTPAEYSAWLRKEDKWGGDIELSIFSLKFSMEIVTLNVKTGLIHRFGESSSYPVRVFMMYDGIHYDPMRMPAPGVEGFFYTSFPSSNVWILSQGESLAVEGHRSGSYTDTQKFTLKCGQCGIKMKGEDEALKHAKETTHTDFEEVKKQDAS